MALLERVATLLRANIHDLLDKAENPPALLKQLLRDMENQLLQVKTQLAAAVADQHVLEAKCAEWEQSAASWRRKAELALGEGEEALARGAAERCLQAQHTLEGFRQQLADQRTESEWMRDRYRQLEAKLAETTSESELLLSAHRRATRRGTSTSAPGQTRQVLGRMRDAVLTAQATGAAQKQIDQERSADIEDRLHELGKRQEVDALLEELKARPHLLPKQT